MAPRQRRLDASLTELSDVSSVLARGHEEESEKSEKSQEKSLSYDRSTLKDDKKSLVYCIESGARPERLILVQGVLSLIRKQLLQLDEYQELYEEKCTKKIANARSRGAVPGDVEKLEDIHGKMRYFVKSLESDLESRVPVAVAQGPDVAVDGLFRRFVGFIGLAFFIF